MRAKVAEKVGERDKKIEKLEEEIKRLNDELRLKDNMEKKVKDNCYCYLNPQNSKVI